jgi:hypothetical protein
VILNGKDVGILRNCDPAKGHISLHPTGYLVNYRNIQIRERTVPAEKAPAFQPLFNGKDLDGWVAHPPWKVWQWEKDALVARTAGAAPVAWAPLESKRTYKDFVMRFQARVLDGEFELRLRNNKQGFRRIAFGNGKWGRVAEGTLYLSEANKVALKNARKTVDEENYNDVVITYVGANITVKINGVTAYEGDTGHAGEGSIEWAVPINMSKVSIRNVEIKELSPPEPAFVPLFNGKDFTGWAGKHDDWKVQDNALVLLPSAKGIDILRTAKEYENYELRFKYRVLKAPEAGGWSAKLLLHLSDLDTGRPAFVELELGTKISPVLRAGDRAVLDFVAQAPVAAVPVSEWNDVRVVCRNKSIVVYFNGDECARAAKCVPNKGPIGLSAWGHEFQFRNIELRELVPLP